MFKVGLSTPGYVNESLFELYQKAGISYMEVSVDKGKSDNLNFDDLKRFSKQYNVNLWSFHLPFWPFAEIDISNKEVSEKTIKYLSEFIKKASNIGIDKFVIHASGEPIEESQRGDRMKCAKQSLSELARIAKENNSVVAVENLPRTCLGRNSDDILELISVDDNLKVCFDTNHLLKENPIEFIQKLGNKIITTHISDYDFIDERHWLPGEGMLDWQAIIKALKNVGYDEMWLYEIDFECPYTISRDRNLVCEDFVRNANELFANKPVTIFSKPKKL